MGVGGHFIGNLDAWVEPGFHSVVDDDLLAEGVNCRGGELVESIGGGRESLFLIGAETGRQRGPKLGRDTVGEQLVHNAVDALSEVRRRGLGEGDCSNRAWLASFSEKHRHATRHQRGLAGTSGRLNHQIGVEVGYAPVACLLVGYGQGHERPSSSGAFAAAKARALMLW